MRRSSVSWFEKTAFALAGLIAAMGLTGGIILSLPFGKIEFSSLDPWIACFALLYGGRFLFHRLRGTTPPASETMAKIRKAVGRLITPPAQARDSTRAAARRPLVLLAVCFGALWLAHVFKHWALQTHGYDLTFLHQSLFHPIVDGTWLRNDLSYWASYFGEHLSYTLFLFVPFTEIWPSDLTIFLFQPLLIGGALFVAVRHGPLRRSRDLWLYATLLLICHRALRNAVVWDFREDDLLFATLTWAAIALYQGKWGQYLVALALSLGTKENVGLITPFLAVPLLWDRRLNLGAGVRKMLAITTVIGSVIWAWVCFKILIPHYNHGIESGNNIVQRFPGLGATPREVLLNILTSPTTWWVLVQTKLLAASALKYLLLLVGPFAYFLWRGGPSAWTWLLPAAPGIAMNLLSSEGTQRSLTFHYDLIILPFLILPTLHGLATFGGQVGAQSRHFVPPARVKLQALTIALLVALGLSGRWPGHALQKHLPTWREFQSARFLANLGEPDPSKHIYAANLSTLAQLSRFEQLRPLNVPSRPLELDRLTAWKIFWEGNQKDRTQIEGHTPLEADQMILDQTIPWEKFLAQEFLLRGWWEPRKDPGERFIWISRR
ncbi:MAG: DUF2079 domain-containing protein [Bacteriovoracia bacterium]